jgi:hypothetical protein
MCTHSHGGTRHLRLAWCLVGALARARRKGFCWFGEMLRIVLTRSTESQQRDVSRERYTEGSRVSIGR